MTSARPAAFQPAVRFSAVHFTVDGSVHQRGGKEYRRVEQAGQQLQKRLTPLVPPETDVSIYYWTRAVPGRIEHPLAIAKPALRPLFPPKEVVDLKDEARVIVMDFKNGTAQAAEARTFKRGWRSIEGFARRLEKQALRLGRKKGLIPAPDKPEGFWARTLGWLRGN